MVDLFRAVLLLKLRRLETNLDETQKEEKCSISIHGELPFFVM
jgi:hypothetical protein